MPAFLLPLLIKMVPYAIAAGIAGYVYFHIKAKGRREAEAKFEAESEAQHAEIMRQVQKAVNADQAVDEKVRTQIDEIRKTEATPPSDPTVFRF